MIIDFVGKIDNFMEASVSTGIIFSYFFFKTPHILIQMIPVATIIAVIVMLCLMKKNREIIALKACGFNIFRIFYTIITISLLIGFFTFLLSELIVPFTSSKSNEIWDIAVEKQDPKRFYGSDHIWYKSSDSIYWIRHFDIRDNIMESPTFYFFDKAFRLIKKIDGRKGVWVDGVWKIKEGIIQETKKDGGYKLTKFDELFLEISETPDTFVRAIKNPEDMSFRQLRRYSERVRLEGYDDTRYMVDANIKISLPFISMILAIIGIPVALGLKKGGTPLAVSIGVGVCFLYTVVSGVSRSLGLSGILPPILSAWSANIIFFFFGIYLIMNVDT
jgi:lipopolysaccharide export system permease protein